MAITSLLDLKLKPESVADAKSVIENILVATRAFEGCLGVEVLVDVADETHVLLLERWASLERDDAYRAWRATPEGTSGMGAIVSSLTMARFTEL